jgi:hypothetical protein
MIRQALDQLKHEIPLLDYLQGHHWQSTGRLSRGRWMGLCPLHQDAYSGDVNRAFRRS